MTERRRLSMDVPVDFKHQLQFISVRLERHMTELVMEAVAAKMPEWEKQAKQLQADRAK